MMMRKVKRAWPLTGALILFFMYSPSWAERVYKWVDKNKIESDVIDSVKTIFSLWKDEKYDVLYEYGDQKSRRAVNREDFKHRMKKKGIKLASSWETIRDIQVDVKSATLGYVTAKIGFKPTKGGETKFRTETYRMSLERGKWKINLTKLLTAKICFLPDFSSKELRML